MASKSTKPDPDLGHQIRIRRKTIGMTQVQLATSVGVSFQQMQKYEKGINAISTDRLRQICDVLSLPPDFFETSADPLIGKADPPTGQAPPLGQETVEQFVVSREGRRLIESFMKITDKRLRTRILDFVSSVSDDTT